METLSNDRSLHDAVVLSQIGRSAINFAVLAKCHRCAEVLIAEDVAIDRADVVREAPAKEGLCFFNLLDFTLVELLLLLT